MAQFIAADEIIGTLRELSAHVVRPLWLFGGVAVDYLVGRWTRPHGDIDLHGLADDRADISRDLARIGYASTDSGWLTHWHQAKTGRSVEIVFLERAAGGEPELVVREGDAVGVPGRYPIVSGYLDPDRWGELDGLRFRVGSPMGEWLARERSRDLVPGRSIDLKIEHDQRLLEGLVPEVAREEWKAISRASRR